MGGLPRQGRKIVLMVLAEKLQSYKTLYKMDKFINEFKQVTKSFLSAGALKVIDLLQTHSVKFKGVSFMKYSYMSEKTGLSIRHLKRIVKTLVELQFIEVWHQWYGNKQIGNIIVIRSDVSIKKIKRMILGRMTTNMSATTKDTRFDMGADTPDVTPTYENEAQEWLNDADFWAALDSETNTSPSNFKNKDIYSPSKRFPLYDWLNER
jgi:hypothetical protein